MDPIGTRIEDCSCPRGGGWRPGARWARREEVQAQIDALPPHQRPPLRELGRRSEAAGTPFRGRGEDRSPPARSGGVAMEAERADGSLAPLITIHRMGPRMEVAAACPAARALGLHPGMAATQAQAMVRGLDIRPADPEADMALLTALALFAVRRWTPRAAISDAGGLWLDLTGASHLFGGEEAMCRRILRFCARLGYSARIAVAGTLGAAHALARHGAGKLILCPSGGEGDAVAPLPLAALRVEEDVLKAAGRLGLERIGELIAMPRGPLNRRFGANLLRRLDQALGAVGEPFDPILPQEPPSATLRFFEPIATAPAIEEALGILMLRLMDTLSEQGLAARSLVLVGDRVDGARQQIGIGTARPTRDPPHLLRLLCAKIEDIEPGFGLDALHLIAGRCEPLGPRPVEGELGGEIPVPDIAFLVDRLAGRLGGRRIFRSSALESDVPERSARRAPPLGPVQGWPRWPRPISFLSPPEKVDRVMAELPDRPPIRFFWRGRMHVVRKADGPERIYGEWWRRRKEAAAVRDYFRVEDEEGARFWLYRRGDGENAHTGDMSWWLQGVFG